MNQILIVGTNPRLTQKVVDFVKLHELEAVGVSSIEDAKKEFSAENFDAVLIGSAVDYMDRYSLIDAFEAEKPSIRFVQYSGNPLSTELIEEIKRTILK